MVNKAVDVAWRGRVRLLDDEDRLSMVVDEVDGLVGRNGVRLLDEDE